MRRSVGILASGLAILLLSAAVSFAGTRSFSIDPYGVAGTDIDKSLGSGGLGGLALPPSGQPEFGFGFVIPRGYKRDTPIRILFSWQTPVKDCGIVFRPLFVDRSRENHDSTAAFGPTDGLAPEDGQILLTAPSTPGRGNVKAFSLTPGQGFGMNSGDAIVLAFFRDVAAPNDTCADDLIIAGINIEYRSP